MKQNMKRNVKRWGAVIGLLLTLAVGTGWADNTWFDESTNFSSYSLGNGRVHFKVLVFARGSANNHWAISGTNVYARLEDNTQIKILSYVGDNDQNTGSDDRGWVKLWPENGTIVITNVYERVNITVKEGSGERAMSLTRIKQTDTPTWLEFDWYPSTALDGKKFTAAIYVHETSKWTDYTHTYTLGDYTAESPQSPLLSDPIFYNVGDNGKAGFGYSLIPYVTYQDPVSYHTSLAPSDEIKTAERSGNLFVMTSDSVQKGYSVTFTVKRDGDQTQEVRSNTVDIPAFHRLYNFKATNYRRSDGTPYNKYTTLSWNIHNPAARDILSTDMFQLERSYYPDFKETESLAMMPIDFDSLHTTYTYVDSTDAALYNKVDRTRPVYYRVIRTSTINWGYSGHDWVGIDSILKEPRLLTLQADSLYYRKADDFDRTKKIILHLRTHAEDSTTFWDNSAEVTVRRTTVSGTDTTHTERIVSGAEFTRQRDGSYAADINLVAEVSCASYTYTAQLSDAASDMKCGTTQPLPCTGPDLYYHNAASVSLFNASKGYYADQVFLQWNQTSGEADYFTLERRIAFKSAPWTKLSDNASGYFYRDRTAEAGQVYEYRITCAYECAGLTLRDSATTYGWLSPVGSIAGTIRFPNGTGNEGVDVRAVRQGEKKDIRRGFLKVETTAHTIMPSQPVNWSGSHTYQLLLKLPEKNTAATNNLFTSRGTLGMVTNYVALDLIENGAKLRFHYGTQAYEVPVTLKRDTWTAFAVVCDTAANTIAVYEDGKQVFGQADVRAHRIGTSNMYLLDQTAHLYIDEVRIWNRALTAKEIEKNTHAYLSGKETLLTHYYTFDGTQNCMDKYAIYEYVSNMAYQNISETDRADLKLEISEASVDSVGAPDESTLTYRSFTNENGEYGIGGVPFSGGATYAVTPTSEYGKFSYNGNSDGIATVTLDAKRPEVTGIDFANTEAVRFTGRVLFRNSTIPVRGANFLINGIMVKDADGNAVETNASGNFSFDVPKAPVTVRVVMPGHTFARNGFFVVEGDSLFQPTQNMDGLRMYDETKVRLVGRIVGGDDQGKLPLGFGLSRNNLGDSLTMALELEGDNTALFVYDPQDPTVSQIDTTVLHPIDSTKAQHTGVVFRQKQILIYPDQSTGEFFVDLFPVKYKVTQLTAQGYSTLTDKNTAMQTLDLTKRLTVDSLCRDGKVVLCNDTFRHVFHSNVSISLTQVVYGMEKGYIGNETAALTVFDSVAQTQALVYKNAAGEYEYLFGKPVFAEGKYTFRVTAHEDYYYNGSHTAAARDQVMLHGNQVNIYNGMHSETETLTGVLNSEGQWDATLQADYPTYTGLNDAVTRRIQVSVEHNGEHIASEPLEVYVFADRLNGVESVSKTHAGIKLYDILRDPPGSGSYASLASGTTYTSTNTWNLSWKLGFNITITHGTNYTGLVGAVAAPEGIGTFSGQEIVIQNSKQTTLPFTYKGAAQWNASYEYTTSESVRTGGDAYHVGAAADVYIGSTEMVYHGIGHGMAVLDSMAYAAMKGQIKDGTMKLISEGRNTDGELRYLVVARKLMYSFGHSSNFAYTQEYILGTVIPTLLRERNTLLLTADSVTAQQKANASKQRVYYTLLSPEADGYGTKDYAWVDPVNADLKSGSDEIASYNRMVSQWIQLLYINEKEKVQAINSAKPYKTYSVTGATPVTYSESHKYSSGYTVENGAVPVSAQGITNVFGKIASGTITKQALELMAVTDRDNNTIVLMAETPEAKFSFQIEPVVDIGFGNVTGNSESHSRSYSYTLAPDDFGYMDVNVYRLKDTINSFNKDADSQSLVPSTDYKYSSFIFQGVAGASRCPYEGGDSTHFYSAGTPLTNPTIAIENPHITVDKREIGNVPADQKAIFTVSLTNEQPTDIGLGTESTIPFDFLVGGGSNPNGLKLSMDGYALGITPVTVRIPHGQTITKTIEAERGQGYDFEDITLIIRSTCDLNYLRSVNISVHFIPSASAIHLSSPHDKWVLNTLSSHDSAGYYLPVTIDGFDIHSDGFDHIELQYKQVNQSDNDWVNICSYYASDSLYLLASGNKAKITGGQIEGIRFYGDRDPVEQQYELRAVSYARYGNGFVTRSSDVLQGTKDTRCPEVFGIPTPADGILTVKESLSVRFSEPIAGNYLDEDANFEVIGGTNNLDITQTTSLAFTGEKNCVAKTLVNRNFNSRAFTIEAMVRPAEQGKAMTIFSLGTSQQRLRFSLTADTCLQAEIGDSTVKSKPLGSLLDFTRCAMTYDTAGVVRFYAGTAEVTRPNQPAMPYYRNSGTLLFGNTLDATEPFHGNMLEARLWAKAQEVDELSLTYKKHLTGFEPELMAYYRMDDGMGTSCTDLANGATLSLEGTSWTLPDNMSLHLSDTIGGVQLEQDIFARSAKQDLTLMFWFKTEQQTADTATLFSTGYGLKTEADAEGKVYIGLRNGNVVLRNQGNEYIAHGAYADRQWHHLVYTVNRAYNIANIFVDGKQSATFAADKIGSLSGNEMWLGACHWTLTDSLGNKHEQPLYAFAGHIDNVVLYEQALPTGSLTLYNNVSPTGEELGLIAYLPFCKQQLTDNGRLELQYYPYNARVFRDSNGEVVNKKQLLLRTDAEKWMDKSDFSPVRDATPRQKYNFAWACNDDELMINLRMLNKEINKQNIFVTVRNVEDLNGNKMVSPVSWTVYVDRNQLRWSESAKTVTSTLNSSNEFDLTISNTGGTTRQYSITSLPSWLTAVPSQGSLAAQSSQTVHFTVAEGMNIGEHTEYIYLQDDQDLYERLTLTVKVESVCPWTDDHKDLPMSMSFIGQVKLTDTKDTVFDTDANDVVAAFIDNRCVGMSHISYNDATAQNHVYMTIYGNESMKDEYVQMRLWQYTTGKIYILDASQDIVFEQKRCYGCAPDTAVLLTTSERKVQQLSLAEGWNWASFNIKPTYSRDITRLLSTQGNWTDGDLVKTPHNQSYAQYAGKTTPYAWYGTISELSYRYIYMFRVAHAVFPEIEGSPLAEAERSLTLNQGWNMLPYLLDSNYPIAEAMSDYLSNAKAGDMLKSKDCFAVFSSESKWEGSLTYMEPGQGYLMYRQGEPCQFAYHSATLSAAPLRKPQWEAEELPLFRNPASSNMSVIATLADWTGSTDRLVLAAYAGNDLVGRVAVHETDSMPLFFLTVGTEQTAAPVRFALEQDGETLAYSAPMFDYTADAIVGSLEHPLPISFAGAQVTALPSPFVDHVEIVVTTPGEQAVSLAVYSESGQLLARAEGQTENGIYTYEWHCTAVPAGIYSAVVHLGQETKTIRLIKQK